MFQSTIRLLSLLCIYCIGTLSCFPKTLVGGYALCNSAVIYTSSYFGLQQPLVLFFVFFFVDMFSSKLFCCQPSLLRLKTKLCRMDLL